MLPSEARETYYSFQSWYYDDKKWTGTWSSREEGHIDDYQQANLPMELAVETVRGKARGEMFNRRVCELSLMLPPVMVEGEIIDGKLVASSYAYVQGQRSLLYTFEVDQDADQLVATVRPLKDPLGLLPDEARLVRRMESLGNDEGPGSSQTSSHPDLQCQEPPMEYLKRLRKEGNRPSVEELGIARRLPKIAPE